MKAMPVHHVGFCNKLQNQYYKAMCLAHSRFVYSRPSVVHTHISTRLAGVPLRKRRRGGEQSEPAHLQQREQIEKQLKHRGDIPAKLSWSTLSYLAKKLSTHSSHGPDIVRSFNG